MDHELVFENSSSGTVYTPPNIIINLKAVGKVFKYQTETDLLNYPGTSDNLRIKCCTMAVKIGDYCFGN